MTRETCSACGSSDLEMFLDLGTSPIADAYTRHADEQVPRYPLRVAVCGKCWLVQLLDVVDGLFGTGYSFRSSASAPLSAYHGAYARDVLTRHSALAARGVLEIGCNDADLLRHFRHLPHLGVDPSTVDAHGCTLLAQPFGLSLAEELRRERGAFGLILANHVLAHVPDLHDVFAGIARLLDDGLAIVEVQYLPDLLVNNAFDLIYHEHRFFFTLTSLEYVAGQHGLGVVDVELTDRQGGSLRATLSRSYGAAASEVTRLRATEAWLTNHDAYTGVQGRVERIRTRLLDLLATLPAPVAAYGAPAKLTTLLSFCGLDATTIGWCVDCTPVKRGRHIPNTGIPIVAPDSRPQPSAYLLAAWNYAGTIMANNPGNRWLIPLPAPVILSCVR